MNQEMDPVGIAAVGILMAVVTPSIPAGPHPSPPPPASRRRHPRCTGEHERHHLHGAVPEVGGLPVLQQGRAARGSTSRVHRTRRAGAALLRQQGGLGTTDVPGHAAHRASGEAEAGRQRRDVNFQLRATFWLGMSMCDDQSAPNPAYPALTDLRIRGARPTATATSTPATTRPARTTSAGGPGGAFMEMQFYPPGWVKWPVGNSCDGTKLVRRAEYRHVLPGHRTPVRRTKRTA